MKQKTTFIEIFLGIMVMTCLCVKGELIKNNSDKSVNYYQSFYYKAQNGQKLKYRFYNPTKNKNEKKYPLVVHFHGAGSRGNNNTSQLYLAKKVTSKKNIKKFPCFVFAPQCPAGKKWVDTNWTKLSHKQPIKPTAQLAMAIAAIEEIIKNYPIDTKRIYVYGQSMGGFATWDIISRCPYMFAAAVPVCGGGDETKASQIADIPIWIFHGTLDSVVKVERSRNMFEALKKAGGTPKYTEYPKVNHDAWNYSYSPKLFEWMFNQLNNRNRRKDEKQSK